VEVAAWDVLEAASQPPPLLKLRLFETAEKELL
jgi:hypothetical protein